jgi:hypothetical protein
VLLSIVATLVSLDEYVKEPALALDGYANAENGAEPYVLFAATVITERIGVPLLTVIEMVDTASVKFAVADCVTSMIVEPTPVILTYEVSIILTILVLRLLYEKVPPPPPPASVFVDEGSAMLNDAFP